MRFFIFGELDTASITELCPLCSVVQEEIVLNGYSALYTPSGRAFLQRGEGEVRGAIIECDEAQAWIIGQWKGVLDLRLAQIPELDGEIYSYFSVYPDLYDEACLSISSNSDTPTAMATFDEIRDFGRLVREGKSLKRADLHLLVPGYFKGDAMPSSIKKSYWGKMLQEQSDFSASSEFNSDFLKNTTRVALGEIEIILDDYNGDRTFVQRAALTLMCQNDTMLCVADIYIPACVASVHRILCEYCGGFIRLRYQGKEMSLGDLCENLDIVQYGARRSMVFAHEELSDELLLNILVNEENPMGKIVSSHFMDIIKNNVAQYDTARVYVSETTMIEITANGSPLLDARIESQAIEIFFVEMLLLEDASVSKIYSRVKEAIADERRHGRTKANGRVITEIIEESSYTTFFADYQQFNFPTVRVSARKIAKAFGIDEIREKYDKSRQILEDMIERHNTELEMHNSEISKHQERIENILLLLLAVLSGVEPLHMGISFIIKNDLWAYLTSIGLLVGLGAIFVLIKRAIGRKMGRYRYDEREEQGYNEK